MDYSGNTPVLHFNPILPECDFCDGSVQQTEFTSYISYGGIVNGSKNIYAAYAHETFGYSGISVSFDYVGVPSFSVGFGSTLSEYHGRPVTL